MFSSYFPGSRPESSEGEPPAFNPAADRHHATLALVGSHPGAPLPSLPALLDPMAISMMPPEFEQQQQQQPQQVPQPSSQMAPKIQELAQQFQHLAGAAAGGNAGPKGSLV